MSTELVPPSSNSGCILTVTQAVLYYVTAVVNVTTDLMIIAIPVVMVFNIQLNRQKRLLIISIFGTRILYDPRNAITASWLTLL